MGGALIQGRNTDLQNFSTFFRSGFEFHKLLGELRIFRHKFFYSNSSSLSAYINVAFINDALLHCFVLLCFVPLSVFKPSLFFHLLTIPACLQDFVRELLLKMANSPHDLTLPWHIWRVAGTES